MTKIKLGFENHLYIGSAGSAAATELTGITDVAITLESPEVDVTARNSGKFKTYIPGMIDARVEFKIFADADDSALTTIRNAWLGRGAFSLKVDLGDNAFFQSDVIVSNFSNDQATEEATAYNVSLKPTITTSAFLPTVDVTSGTPG